MSTAAASTITIHVNDEERTFAAPTTVLGALQELGLATCRGVAVAIDDQVVTRREWPVRTLAAGERLLVIQATQGG